MDIAANIAQVRHRAANALGAAGRDLTDITIIAVSKTVSADRVQQAVDAGLSHLGENRVQELTSKYLIIKGNVNWHVIGTLQRNKVKYIIDKAALIHSLDSVRLAEEIDRQANRITRIMPVLVQVNIGRESAKSGVNPEDAPVIIKELAGLKNLKVQGLMAIPPLGRGPEESRPYFKAMKQLFDTLANQSPPNVEMQYLSMGMTHDFEIALQEGANIIRVGTGIFGSRK